MTQLIKSLFSQQDIEISKQDTIYQGFAQLLNIQFRFRLFAGGWSKILSREVYTRRHAAGILLYDPKLDQVLLVEQFRIGMISHAQSPWLLETVAGVIEEHQSAEAVARQEAQEEAGIEVGEIIPVSEFWASPSYSTEKVMLFCGKVDLSQAGGVYGLEDEGEDIQVHILPTTTAFELVASRQIADPKALITLQWLQLNKTEIQAKWLVSNT